MKTIRILLISSLVLCLQIILQAQSNCYETQRQKGIQLYNLGEYSAAYKNFEAAKFCTDLPANNDLASWMSKCIIVVKLSVESLDFDAEGGEEQCVEVTTNAKSYKVASAPEWCILNQQGKMLYVSCEDNLEVEPREGKIQITSGGKSAYFDVFQDSAAPELEFDPSPVVFSSKNETRKVLVTSNFTDWAVDSNPDWIVAERIGDTLQLDALHNASSYVRESEVTVMASEQVFRLPISQLPGDTVITVSRKELVYPKETAMEIVTVSCNIGGWQMEALDDWIDLTQVGDTVRIAVKENPSLFSRHGKVRFFSGRRSSEIELHQAPHVSNFDFPESELANVGESGRETISVTSIPSELVVYVDDTIAMTTPFTCNVDYEHHSLQMGFERREFLFNEKQKDVVFKPGLRFAELTFTSPKNIGLQTGFVAAKGLGAYCHFQASRPIVKEFVLDTISPSGYHFMLGPVYQPIPYVAVYAGVGFGIYEGVRSTSEGSLMPSVLPILNLNYEGGVMGFYKNIIISMGFRTSHYGYNGEKSTSFVFGVGGYLKRYYDKQFDPGKRFCCSDSRRWWSLNYVARPAMNGKGAMFGDLGRGKIRTYLKAMYSQPTGTEQIVDASFGVIFTPVNGIIDVCLGGGAGMDIQNPVFGGVNAEVGAILNIWRIPITIMLHENDIANMQQNRGLYVDFGIGFHLGKFRSSSYK